VAATSASLAATSYTTAFVAGSTSTIIGLGVNQEGDFVDFKNKDELLKNIKTRALQTACANQEGYYDSDLQEYVVYNAEFCAGNTAVLILGTYKGVKSLAKSKASTTTTPKAGELPFCTTFDSDSDPNPLNLLTVQVYAGNCTPRPSSNSSSQGQTGTQAKVQQLKINSPKDVTGANPVKVGDVVSDKGVLYRITKVKEGGVFEYETTTDYSVKPRYLENLIEIIKPVELSFYEGLGIKFNENGNLVERMDNPQAKAVAKSLGYTEYGKGTENSIVFKNSATNKDFRFISADRYTHSGGAWKVSKDPIIVDPGRTGTYNIDLTKYVGK
jgi:Novel toxin 21